MLKYFWKSKGALPEKVNFVGQHGNFLLIHLYI